MIGSLWSVLPPLLVILCVFLTKRVILSISVGIVSAAFIYNDFNLISTLNTIFQSFWGQFYDDGIQFDTLCLVAFLFILGMITVTITKSGGTAAFVEWAHKKIRSKRTSQFLAFFLGIIIFIDDYFNALTVGQVARPLTDKYGVSRTKLAYVIDSTSAPVCVLSPISSWGAYILGIIGALLVDYQISGMSSFSAFMQIIPLNFYALFSLAMVVCTIYFNLNFGSMKKFEGKIVQEDLEEKIPTVSKKNSPWDLLLPILAMFVSVLAMIGYTGATAAKANGLEVNIFSILENNDIYLSLFGGGIIGLVVALVKLLSLGIKENILFTLAKGAKSMLGAVLILIFAWSLTGLIGDIQTGTYLSGLLEVWNITPGLIPLFAFILSGFMAFATGTSWGTFGLMLPIGAQMAVTLAPELLLPILASVLAGAVFGDHCSPISDTTILSSTGAKCDHIDHVTTQIPYALLIAGISAASYLVLGLTGNRWIGFGFGVTALMVAVWIIKQRNGEGQTV